MQNEIVTLHLRIFSLFALLFALCSGSFLPSRHCFHSTRSKKLTTAQITNKSIRISILQYKDSSLCFYALKQADIEIRSKRSKQNKDSYLAYDRLYRQFDTSKHLIYCLNWQHDPHDKANH